MENIFYDHEDAEILHHTHPDEAVEAYLDNYYPMKLPRKMKLVHYKTEVISEKAKNYFIDYVSEMMWEKLEEEWGNFEEDRKIPKNIDFIARNAAREYVDNFPVWRCKSFYSEEIDCVEWVNRNAPEWLEDTEFEDK